jgi:hypothetical protein
MISKKFSIKPKFNLLNLLILFLFLTKTLSSKQKDNELNKEVEEFEKIRSEVLRKHKIKNNINEISYKEINSFIIPKEKEEKIITKLKKMGISTM